MNFQAIAAGNNLRNFMFDGMKTKVKYSDHRTHLLISANKIIQELMLQPMLIIHSFVFHLCRG